MPLVCECDRLHACLRCSVLQVLGMLMHANHLESEYGAGPHTISVPRMRAAAGSDISEHPPHPVDDANFKKLVAILRISVPYTGMILSTRQGRFLVHH
jgi:2-iminoacetate synthase